MRDESSLVGKIVKDAEVVGEKTKLHIERSENVIEEIRVNLVEVEDVRRDVQKRLDKLHALQTTHQYMKVVDRIEFLRLVSLFQQK